jgi:hypothetical protein
MYSGMSEAGTTLPGMRAGPSHQAQTSSATKPKLILNDVTTFVILLLYSSAQMAKAARIEEIFIRLESRDCYSYCLDCIRNSFTKHGCKREATGLDGSETCWAKLVDDEAPCLMVVLELALAFRY